MNSEVQDAVENHMYGPFDEFLRERISINTIEYVVDKYSNENPDGKFKMLNVFRHRIGFGTLSLTSKLVHKLLNTYPRKEIVQAQAMFQWYKIQKQIVASLGHSGITENECYKRAVIFHNTYPQLYEKLDTNYWWYQWFLKNSIFSQDQMNLDLVEDPNEMHDFKNPDEYIDTKETDFNLLENSSEGDSIENIIMESFENDEYIIKAEAVYGEAETLLDPSQTFTNYEIIEMENNGEDLQVQLESMNNSVRLNDFSKKVNKKNKIKRIGERKK